MNIDIPNGVYFKAAESVRYTSSDRLVRKGAQIIAFSKETNKKKQIFTARTRKRGSTASYMFERGMLFDVVEDRFVNSGDLRKYLRVLNYAKGFAFLLGKGYKWCEVVELNNKAYLFYASLYKEA